MKIIKALILNILLSSIVSLLVVFPSYYICLDLLPENSSFIPFVLWIALLFILGFCHVLIFLPLYLWKRKEFESLSSKENFKQNFSILLLPLVLYLFIGYQINFGLRFNYQEFELYILIGIALITIHSFSFYSFINRLSAP